jgi:thiamine transport system permease protein
MALSAIAILICGAFAGLVVEALRSGTSALDAFDGYLVRIALFTIWQAVLSTLISVLPAIAIARALSRHPSFPGRALLLRLFALPLALPAIVAALGLLALYGRAGYAAAPLSDLLGTPWPGIYGLSGILVAHAFFNMPLAARLLLAALDTVSADQWRLASQLGMGAWPTFRLVEWPAMRAALPGVAGLVFMLCATSFTLVLTLGGGPQATTLEVAIYQALRFDFDPGRAVALTLLQVAITVVVLAMLTRLGAAMTADGNLGVTPRRPRVSGTGETVANALLLALAAAFICAPLLATVVAGLEADLTRLAQDPSVRAAAISSLVLAALAALVSVALSLALVSARGTLVTRRRGQGRASLIEMLVETGAGYVLVVPPVVIGAGWFLALRGIIDPFAAAPVMVVAVNAVMAMPFALRAIRPAHEAAAARHDRLCETLGIMGANRLRIIDLPVLRRPILTAAAFAMALSLGDLGVVALFGSDAVQTLPYLLLARMGSYRTDDAAGIALILGLLCLSLLWLADRLARENTP